MVKAKTFNRKVAKSKSAMATHYKKLLKGFKSEGKNKNLSHIEKTTNKRHILAITNHIKNLKKSK